MLRCFNSCPIVINLRQLTAMRPPWRLSFPHGQPNSAANAKQGFARETSVGFVIDMACSFSVGRFVNGNIGRNYGMAFVMASLMAGCAAGPAAQGDINDPNESVNRAVHGFNKGVDTVFLRPASRVYGAVVPAPVRTGVNNFAENLEGPGDVVNNILQGRIGDAGTNTLRFAVNTTMGIGGLFDAATFLGLPEGDTDFGETLHVWGAGEGAYVELPIRGPSTTRDAAGQVVDLFLNPFSYVLKPAHAEVATGAEALSIIGDRYKFGETADSILYDSADSYAQARLLYLQNRRFELGQEAESDDAFLDPYEDPYAE
jgi:phospholipid-binding lipoprotein MlaA